MRRWGVVALSCALAVAAFAQQGSKSGSHAELFVSGDVRGYLGPCGCSENMRGGIARAAQQVLEAREKNPNVFFLDAGDALFGKLKVTPQTLPQEKRKAVALAEAFRLMGLATRVSGEKDDLAGAAFRKSLGLPEVMPGEVKVLPLASGEGAISVVGANDRPSLLTGAKLARPGSFVIALFHGTLAQAQAASQDLGATVHLIVAAHADTEFEGEESRLVRGRIPVATVQSKGRSLLRVEVWFEGQDGPFELLSTAADAERELQAMSDRIALLNKQINLPGLSPEAKALRQAKLEELIARRRALEERKVPTPDGKNAFAVRFIPLEATLPGAPAATRLVEAYDRDVGLLNLEWARKHGKDCPKPRRGEAAFVGSESCRECHEDAFPIWEKTKHFHGYDTLAQGGKQYHLDCVGCHITGFQRPGGVCRVDKVKGRQGVGCESCHGPGSLHAEDPSDSNISLGNTEAVCVGCHDPENSPAFDFRTYLPEVLGVGHGKKR